MANYIFIKKYVSHSYSLKKEIAQTCIFLKKKNLYYIQNVIKFKINQHYIYASKKFLSYRLKLFKAKKKKKAGCTKAFYLLKSMDRLIFNKCERVIHNKKAMSIYSNIFENKCTTFSTMYSQWPGFCDVIISGVR